MIFGIPSDFIWQVMTTLALNLMQVFTAYTITLFLFKKKRISLIRVIVTTFFCYLASIILLLTLLGLSGLLYFQFLVPIVLLLFLTSLWFYLKKKDTLLPTSKIFVPSESKNVFFWAFVSVILFIILVKFFISSLQIVTESDSLVYHMPFVARWYQLGHIWEPYFTAYAGPLGYYPSNYELFLLWFVFPFQSDLIVNLVNFLIYPFFFMLFYLVLRQFSVRHDLSLLVTFVGTTIPVILRQLGIPQNDLFFMLFFLYSIYFLFSFLRHKSGLYVSLLGLALGIFFGTKYTGVPGALPLFIASIGSVIWVSFHKKKVWHALRVLLPLFVLLFVLGGSFWYIRNLVHTGNPFFPIDVDVFGFRLFDGYDGLTEKVFEQAMVSHIGEFGLLHRVVKTFGLSAGLISLFLPIFFVVALGLAISLVVKVAKKSRAARNHFLHFLFFLILIPVYVLIYVHAPYTYIHIYPNVRYALPVLLLGLLMLGKIAAFKRVFFRPIVFFLLASFFSYFFFIFPFQSRFLTHTNDYVWFDVDLVFSHPFEFLLLIGFALSLLAVLVMLFRKKSLLLGIASVVMICFLLPYSYYSSLIRDERGYNDEFLRGEQADSVLDAYQWADDNIDDDSRIAYTSVGSHYHLFGKNFTRDVSYVNINDCRDCLYHDFKHAENSILTKPSFKNWFANLRAQEKDYLIVGWKYFDDDPYELIWAKRYPKYFKLLFKEKNTYIFKINY